MGWHGHLKLTYRHAAPRTVVHDEHNGPLRILQSLYPEGDAICHNVLVHPPGGVVGGDVLQITAQLGSGSHALITTPGATRFYRSTGALAQQALTAQVSEGARLEWLPLETILYRNRWPRTACASTGAGCRDNRWDVLRSAEATTNASTAGSHQAIELRRVAGARPGDWQLHAASANRRSAGPGTGAGHAVVLRRPAARVARRIRLLARLGPRSEHRQAGGRRAPHAEVGWGARWPRRGSRHGAV